jgi:hypothetical protein
MPLVKIMKSSGPRIDPWREDREALKAALVPHRKDLQRFLRSSEGAASSGGGGEGGGFDHLHMRGGFIFSLILGALVPVLVDLVVKAAS